MTHNALISLVGIFKNLNSILLTKEISINFEMFSCNEVKKGGPKNLFLSCLIFVIRIQKYDVKNSQKPKFQIILLMIRIYIYRLGSHPNFIIIEGIMHGCQKVLEKMSECLRTYGPQIIRVPQVQIED